MTLAATDLCHAYGARAVLRRATFAASAPGSLTALIGPNAAGKSTLFRALAGMIRPISGRMMLDGADLAAMPARARNRAVGFMPQVFASNAALTVFEVVMLARKQLSGWAVAREDTLAVAALLDRMGIAHLAAAQVGEISGGQGQMVSAAQALIRAPRVFLFDEPTSALDLRRQLELMALIRDETRSRNVTSIVAMHDLNLAARFADTMLLMRQGEILAQGAPDAVLADPRVGETYGVGLDLIRHPKGGLHVSAFL
jgi:iron complex transport system ATP-binding protein